MHQQVIQVKKWDRAEPPIEAALIQQMRDEGMQPTRWSNTARTIYHANTNDHDKVIYIISGSIILGFRVIGEPTVLTAGDRLSLPAGVEYNAVVGDEGVVCLEGKL